MKIYVKDPDDPKFKDLRDFCEKHGITLHPLNGFGRPKKDIAVKKVLNTYATCKSYRETARILDINPGHVYMIVKTGVRNPVENDTMENGR